MGIFGQLIVSAMPAVGAAGVLALLRRSSRLEARSANGEFVLEYGTTFRVFVVVAWCVVAAITAVAILAPGTNKIYAIPLIGGFVALLLPVHLEVFGVRFSFNDSELHARSPWRRARHVRWDAVRTVRFVPFLNWYEIRTDVGTRVRVPIYLNGVGTLLTELVKHGVAVPARHPQ